MSKIQVLLAATGTVLLLAGGVAAQTAFPPAGYSPLLFDPGDTKYVFRLNGTPWICRGDTFCKPVKIEGVADKDLAQATIEPLGVAGARYFLSYKQGNFEKGKEIALACTEERCGKLDATAGDVSPLGTFQVKQGDRVVTRTALLRQLDAKNGRAQILWCTETDCSELPLTRDAELYLAAMGNGRSDGRTKAWLRDKSGAVLSCAQPDEGVSDQLACEKTQARPVRLPGCRRRSADTGTGACGGARATHRRHRHRRPRRTPTETTSPPPSIGRSPPAISPRPTACSPMRRGAMPATRLGRRCSRSSPGPAPIATRSSARPRRGG